MFQRSQSKLGPAILRSLKSDAVASCWEGLSTGMNAASRMAVRCDAGHVAPRLVQHSRQGNSFSTFASRLHLEQQSLGRSRSQYSPHNAAHPSNTLFHVPGPQRSGRVTWSGRGRSMSTIAPENVVYGIMAVNAAVFLAWQQPSLKVFMTNHFTGVLP